MPAYYEQALVKQMLKLLAGHAEPQPPSASQDNREFQSSVNAFARLAMAEEAVSVVAAGLNARLFAANKPKTRAPQLTDDIADANPNCAIAISSGGSAPAGGSMSSTWYHYRRRCAGVSCAAFRKPVSGSPTPPNRATGCTT